MNFTKELWFALFFLSIGFTIWPLMIYYLGLSIGLEFFLNMKLRFWAEQIIYGPLGSLNIYFMRSIIFLSAPYIFFNLVRILIALGNKTYASKSSNTQ